MILHAKCPCFAFDGSSPLGRYFSDTCNAERLHYRGHQIVEFVCLKYTLHSTDSGRSKFDRQSFAKTPNQRLRRHACAKTTLTSAQSMSPPSVSCKHEETRFSRFHDLPINLSFQTCMLVKLDAVGWCSFCCYLHA